MADRSITVRLRLQDDFSAPMKKAAEGVKGFSDSSQEVEKTGGIFDSIKEKFSELTGESGSLKDALAGVAGGFAGGIIGGGIAEGIGSIGGAMMDAVGAASDLNETINKSQAIFGAQAAGIEQWAGGAARNFGLSKASALDYAASLGDMFTQLGNTGEQSAKMSKQTVQLAADLGSFSNLDTGDVLDRISAAFRGEYDSLQAIVPNINAARVETEALAETGKKSASQLTAQEKATATLNIVMKDTSRAQGDFAKTSDQAANQAKINAAQMEDLKAKVGQGLLPVYKTFLNLIGNVGLPALGKLVEVGGAVVGAVGPLVDVFRGLPGPVKTAAAALVALAVANRVFGTRISAARAGVASFATGIRNIARTQQLAVTSADGLTRTYRGVDAQIARLGQRVPTIARMQGAFLGAAAGASRFPRAAGAARAAMVGLRGAAGGVVNMLGGPFGVALLGAGVALMAWQKHQQDAAQAALESEARVQALTDTLNKHTGAVTEDTRATVADTLQKEKVFAAARELGISYKDVTDAALGNEAAQKRVNDKLGVYKKAAEDAGAAATQNNADSINLAKTMGTVSDAINGNNAEVKRSITRWHELAQATGKEADQFRKAAPAADEYTVAQKRAAKATKDAEKAASDMRAALDKVSNAFLELRGGERGYEAAIDDATAALKKNGKTLDETTAKGRENATALDSIASSAQSVLKQMGDRGMSAASITDAYRSQHAELVRMAEAFGYSAAEAKKYADQALTLPKEVKTSYDLDVTKAKAGLAAARAAAKELGVDFDSLPASVQTKLATTGGKDAKKIIQDVTDKANGVPKGLHIKTDTPGAADSNVRLKQLTVTAVTADGKIVSIKCSTPGQAKALHDILALHGAQISADGKHVTITSSTPLSKENKKRIDDLKGAAVSADGKRVTIDTSAPGALEAYNRITSALRAAQSKTLTITTVYKEIHPGDNLARHGRGLGGAANGAVVKPGGHRYMADGGVAGRQAMVAPAGSWITWAEDETHGESYIPWALSKRARAEAILSYTASQFGFEPLVKRAADGYMSSHMTDWRRALPVQSTPQVIVQASSNGGLSNADRALMRQYIQVSQRVLAAMPGAVEKGLAGRRSKDAQSAHLARNRGGN